VNRLRHSALFVCRVAIAVLFLFAAWQKLKPGSELVVDSGPQKFAMAISSFKILPDHLVHLAAGVIPWLEVLCAVLVLVGVWTRAAATVLTLLMIGFTAAVVSVLLRQMSLTCGCFGNLTLICPKGAMSWCKVGENAIILVPCLLVAIFGGGWLDFDRLRMSNASRPG
jgi:uncharacterized membrane protein YphA (DoxX/SURF4 family)